MSKNSSSEYGTVVPKLHSIKFKLHVVSWTILIISAVIISLSVYSFFTYFKQNNYYASEYYKILEMRDSFINMNTAAENYWINNNDEELNNYTDSKDTLGKAVDDIEADIVSGDDDEKAIIHALISSIRNYSSQLSELMLSQDKTAALSEYYQYYQPKSEYIIKYSESLLNIKFINNQEYFQNTEHDMYIMFISELIVFALLLFCIIYCFILIFKKTINPLMKLSSYLVEISLGNFDIDDMPVKNKKHNDEITIIISMFNNMKRNLRDMFRTCEENLLTTQKLLEEQRKYQIVKKQLLNEQEQNEILFKKANYDNLTQIFNRQAFEINVRETIAGYDDSDLGALFVIDVDNFKSVNDTLGHQGGDEVLKALALCLKNTLADCGFAGRWGGDEFVGFISNAPNIHFIRNKASDLCSLMNRQFLFKGILHHISISIGVCPMKKNDELGVAYEHADMMLYEVKKMGRNNFKIYLNSNESYEFKE
ncbi:MAG: diguanylate cyclase domain-containing protein [Oscillospiraceae bacterium]